MPKLYELPRDKGIKLAGFEVKLNGKPIKHIIFGHIDGMYSYCWLEGHPDKVVHLNASTPLKKVSEDTYEVVDVEEASDDAS